MAITAEVEIAGAAMNDSYGVAVWVREGEQQLTPLQAMELAQEIDKAAAEALRVEREDRAAGAAGDWAKAGL